MFDTPTNVVSAVVQFTIAMVVISFIILIIRSWLEPRRLLSKDQEDYWAEIRHKLRGAEIVIIARRDNGKRWKEMESRISGKLVELNAKVLWLYNRDWNEIVKKGTTDKGKYIAQLTKMDCHVGQHKIDVCVTDNNGYVKFAEILSGTGENSLAETITDRIAYAVHRVNKEEEEEKKELVPFE